jgi:NADP-dependent 3-hydroxy acid dehydrogenase YdfG
VVANAGVMLLGQIEGADTTEWRRMIEPTPSVRCTPRIALPHLPPRRAGAPAGRPGKHEQRGGPPDPLGSGVYNASKHAVGASPRPCGWKSSGTCASA